MGKPQPDGVSRREFIAGATASLALTSATTARPHTGAGQSAGRKPRVPLFCDRGGLINPTQPSDEKAVREFVETCVRHGVTTLLPWNGTELLTRVAHEHGLDVHPYLAFNNHGEKEVRYAWSVNFISHPPGTPEGEEILNHHRPIWSHRREQLDLSDFARENPAFWCRERTGRTELLPGRLLSLSLAHPEVRAYEIGVYLDLFKSTGSDGVQVEFISITQDEDRVGIYGYEDAMAQAFEAAHGKSPFSLENGDPAWLQFRADLVTQTLRELRAEVKKVNPEAVFSIALIARPTDEYMKVFLDWPAWLDEGLVDEFYLWFRTASDGAELEKRVAHAATTIDGRCPLVAELSCYHPGSYQDPKVLLDMARQARTSGADSVGVYRSHSVDQLELWPVMEAIAGL